MVDVTFNHHTPLETSCLSPPFKNPGSAPALSNPLPKKVKNTITANIPILQQWKQNQFTMFHDWSNTSPSVSILRLRARCYVHVWLSWHSYSSSSCNFISSDRVNHYRKAVLMCIPNTSHTINMKAILLPPCTSGLQLRLLYGITRGAGDFFLSFTASSVGDFAGEVGSGGYSFSSAFGSGGSSLLVSGLGYDKRNHLPRKNSSRHLHIPAQFKAQWSYFI